MRRFKDKYIFVSMIAPFYNVKMEPFDKLIAKADSQFDEKTDRLLEEKMQKKVEELRLKAEAKKRGG